MKLGSLRSHPLPSSGFRSPVSEVRKESETRKREHCGQGGTSGQARAMARS